MPGGDSPTRNSTQVRLEHRTHQSSSGGAGCTPYLDVMTVSSAQFPVVLQGKDTLESYKSLLVEPIQIPDLEHVQAHHHLSASPYREKPLFYPSGAKSSNFRDTIRESLRSTVEGVDQELDHEAEEMSFKVSDFNKKNGKASQSPSKKSGTPSPTKLRSLSRPVDKEVKNLLQELRENNDKLSILASRG